jgi:hypothetical protein
MSWSSGFRCQRFGGLRRNHVKSEEKIISLLQHYTVVSRPSSLTAQIISQISHLYDRTTVLFLFGSGPCPPLPVDAAVWQILTECPLNDNHRRIFQIEDSVHDALGDDSSNMNVSAFINRNDLTRSIQYSDLTHYRSF